MFVSFCSVSVSTWSFRSVCWQRRCLRKRVHLPCSVACILYMKRAEMNTLSASIVMSPVARCVVLGLFHQNVLFHLIKQSLFYYLLTAFRRLFRILVDFTLWWQRLCTFTCPTIENENVRTLLVAARDLLSTAVNCGMFWNLQKNSTQNLENCSRIFSGCDELTTCPGCHPAFAVR